MGVTSAFADMFGRGPGENIKLRRASGDLNVGFLK